MLHKGTKAPYALILPAAKELLEGEYGVPRKSISTRVAWANTQAQGAPGALDNSGSSRPGPRFCRRKKERVEKVPELDAGDNNKEYKVEAICDSAVYTMKLESGHLPGLYYLVT